MAKAKAKKESMMAAAFRLIRAGRTNEQVTAYLKKEHKLPEKHKHYASWFRGALVRQLKEAGGESALVKKIQAAGARVSKQTASKKTAVRKVHAAA